MGTSIQTKEVKILKKLRGILLTFILFLFIGGCNPSTSVSVTPTPISTSTTTPTPIATTATTTMVSYLYLDSDDGIKGNIWIDGAYKGYLPSNGTLNLYNLQKGNHVLTIDTLPNVSATITVLNDGQNIYINLAGHVWW